MKTFSLLAKNKIYFILLALIFASPNIAFSQNILSGVVVDKENKPIDGANVLIKELNKGQATNSYGKFQFDDLKSREYTLVVSFIGYKTYNKKIELNTTQNILVELKRSSILSKEIVITATRASRKTPIAYTNISKSEINKNNLAQDIPILLELTPSYTSTSDGGTGVGYTNMRIRGSDNTRINVTMNGIPMNDAESHGVWWVNMPDLASSLEDIQIQRGVGTSTNGAGSFGASINLRTNSLKENPYGEAQVSYGSFNTQKYNVKAGTGLLADKFTLDARVSKIKTDGYIDRAKADLQSIFLTSSYYGNKNSVIFNYINGSEKTYQAWNGVPKKYLDIDSLRTYNKYTYKNEIDNYNQTHYQLFYKQNISDNWNSEVAGFYVRGKGYYEQYKEKEKLENGYGLTLRDDKGNIIEKSDLVRQKWLDNNFYGTIFNISYNDGKTNFVTGGGLNKYSGFHYGKVLWVKNAKPQNFSNTEYYRNKAEKTDFNIYSKINRQIHKKINLYVDLQYRQIEYKFQGLTDVGKTIPSIDKLNFFLPKTGINYTPTKNSTIFFSYARGAKEPNRNDYTENVRSQIPEPEYLNDFEAGYKISFSSIAFEANAYYMQYKNQLIATGKLNDVGNTIRTNVSNSYRSGLELVGGWKISSIFRWDANMSYSKNIIQKYTEYIDDWDTGKQIPANYNNTVIAFSPDIIASSNFTITPLKGLSFGVISKYISDQYIDNTQSEKRKLNSYMFSNLRAEYNFSLKSIENIALTLMLNNIFDAKYETNAWVYKYKSGDGSYDGSFGDIYSTKSDKAGYYDMAGYFPQAGINFLLGVNIKI